MEKKKVVRKKKNTKKHIVVFQDAEKKMLKTVFAEDGHSVEAPSMEAILEEKEHHRVVFQGWDQDLSKVTENLVVNPIYQEVPKEYLVMYFHENGKILGTETVAYNQSAKMPFHPEKPDTEEYTYHFTGWNCDLSHIQSDCMAKAVFETKRKQFLVRFFHENGELLKEESVYYGETAHAPENVLKEEDSTFRYHFAGWDGEFSIIHEDTNVKALFQEEYINYILRFFEEGTLVEEKSYHYGQEIVYPELWKKGYKYIWKDPIQNVTESKDFDGYWEYSNPKGKRFKTQNALYEIMDPSIIAGTVRCLSYESNLETVQLPKEVKLGDYYYCVEALYQDALSDCRHAKKIICPDTMKILEKNCFRGASKVESIILGKNIQEMDANVFAECPHLHSILLNCGKIKKIHRNAFEKMNRRVELIVPSKQEQIAKKLFEKAIRQKEMVIVKR
ncbi:MAG: leucine-rich repeat domain-containing protein [Eubacteriales bacterium]|nr:leucine-rich repeat domain-containing protein [Eubacteriales bacterium]